MVFDLSYEIAKKFLKIMRKKKKKHNKVILLARSKLNSIENIISKAVTGAEIDHKEFTISTNEEKKYCKLEENIKIIKSEGRNI